MYDHDITDTPVIGMEYLQDNLAHTLLRLYEAGNTTEIVKLAKDAKIEYAVTASGDPGTNVRVPSNHPNFKVRILGVGLHGIGIKVKFISPKARPCYGTSDVEDAVKL